MKSFILPVLAAAATLSATNAAVIPHGEESTPAPTHFAGDKRFLCIYFGGYWWGFGCDNDDGDHGDGGNGANGGSAASSAAAWSASSASAYSATSQAAAWSRSSSAAAYSASSSAAAYSANAAAYSTSSSAAAYSSRAGAYSSAVAYSQASSAAANSRASSVAAYSAASSAAAYSAGALQYSASSSAAAYSAHAAAYSSAAAAYSDSASAAAFSASAIAAQSSLGAYSASAAAHASQIAAFSSSASAAAYSAKQSLDSYSASVAQASQSASVAAYSASASAAAAAQSAQAYSATSSMAAYSASVSAAVYSAGLAAASASASLAAFSASQSVAAYSASVASAASSASSYSASVSAAAAQSTAIPSGWNVASTACISEGITGRALTSDMMSSGEMTWSKCTSFCGSKGYPLAGIEYASECYCGYVLSNGASLDRASNQCNMATSGNAKTIGGGPSVLSLFVSDSLDRSQYSSDLTAIDVALPGSWSALLGSGICVREGSTGRALAGALYASDDMTIGKCLAFCEGKGMQYAGIEYGRECYCGNELVNGASLSDTAPCSMQCGGQPGTLCGAGNLLSIYRNANFQYTNTAVGGFAKQGCIQEVAGRALTGASTAAGDMTTAKCTSFCAAGGYAWAGIEYGSECYCGNSLSNGASLSLYSTQCNMACSGAPGETCGGPNAITLYSTLSGNALVGA